MMGFQLTEICRIALWVSERIQQGFPMSRGH